MYERDISRRDPGCVVFLLDRSDSMKQTWGNSRETMAEGAARALNETLLELLFTSQGEPGKARHYFDVGIFGYGLRPVAGGEGVEPAFGGKLAGQPLVALPDLRDNPIAVRETPSVDVGAPPSRVPVWVEPVYGHRTPMCQAVAVAGAHVYEWANAHPDSFPPIIINITDGMVTDSPYRGRRPGRVGAAAGQHPDQRRAGAAVQHLPDSGGIGQPGDVPGHGPRPARAGPGPVPDQQPAASAHGGQRTRHGNTGGAGRTRVRVQRGRLQPGQVPRSRYQGRRAGLTGDADPGGDLQRGQGR